MKNTKRKQILKVVPETPFSAIKTRRQFSAAQVNYPVLSSNQSRRKYKFVGSTFNMAALITAPPTTLRTELFVQPLPKSYECIVCTNIMSNCVMACKNGHSFCNTCIARWRDVQRKRSCPKCIVPLSPLVPNRTVADSIDEAVIYCFTRFVGDGDWSSNAAKKPKIKKCKWTGQLSKAAAHFQVCAFVGVQCTYVGCSAVVRRSALAAHQQECACRMQLCKWAGCGEEVSKNVILRHELKCPCRVITCPNTGCGATLPFDTLTQHRRQCNFEEVSCPFAAVGCAAFVLCIIYLTTYMGAFQ